ncbi:MAG TPA: hypothetical protein VH796_03250 [Nitrososphaeraceae archaeon]|jgi:hypothetical protein
MPTIPTCGIVVIITLTTTLPMNNRRCYKCRLCGQLCFANEFVSHLDSAHAVRKDILNDERGLVEALFIPDDDD